MVFLTDKEIVVNILLTMNNTGILSIIDFFQMLDSLFYSKSRKKRNLRKQAKIHITVAFLITNFLYRIKKPKKKQLRIYEPFQIRTGTPLIDN